MIIKILCGNRNGEVYNVGNSKNIATVGEFAKYVSLSFKKSIDKNIDIKVNPTHPKYYQLVVKSIIPDISKFVNHYGYMPDTTLSEACLRTAKYYLNISC
jgi:nucleoside-diphosphate-sugar epimerase